MDTGAVGRLARKGTGGHGYAGRGRRTCSEGRGCYLLPAGLPLSGAELGGLSRRHSEGEALCPSPSLPSTPENGSQEKHKQAPSVLCAENPSESSGIHLLLIESGPNQIVFSTVENITLHHDPTMFQASP